MPNKNLKLKLTKEQQKQISEATGKNISELNIDVASGGQISDADLERVAGGLGGKKNCGGTSSQCTLGNPK